ncbi:MAG: 3-isopropylmalate dehydratase small subunit [Anaerolineales bacterium]|nr:3-isopropylmalate dehydratase small subunit [Anaerolineales bacterium]
MLTGIAHVYGDNIDTDRIIPGKYTKTLEPGELARHVLEDLDPGFAARVRPGDLLVAGHNFGCGSSREQAPIALKAAGVACVIARSFARLFYRNAINIGLPVVEAPDHVIENGQRVRVDLAAGTVTNESTGQTFAATRMPEVMARILSEGGLVNYLVKYGDYQA